ncbi:MAG: ADP-heptose--LPS heptosyltransferase, partial [Ignavibacteriaceae bacterium]
MISPGKILVVRTDRIGDVVLSLPLAEIIRQKYPQSRVSYFLREYTSSLLEQNPFIDEVIIA